MRVCNGGTFFTVMVIILCLSLAAGCAEEEKTIPGPKESGVREPTTAPIHGLSVSGPKETGYGMPEPVDTTVPMTNPSFCDPKYTDYVLPEPVDTTNPVSQPLPGARYSLNESDSGKTITLRKGETFEITLQAIPGLGYRWFMPVTGSGLELMNYGTYSVHPDTPATDYTSSLFPPGKYRLQYRAASTGTSVFDGIFTLISPCRPGYTAFFNLTVNVV